MFVHDKKQPHNQQMGSIFITVKSISIKRRFQFEVLTVKPHWHCEALQITEIQRSLLSQQMALFFKEETMLKLDLRVAKQQPLH